MTRGFLMNLTCSFIMSMVFAFSLLGVFAPATLAVLPAWAAPFSAVWLSMTLALLLDLKVFHPTLLQIKTWVGKTYYPHGRKK